MKKQKLRVALFLFLRVADNNVDPFQLLNIFKLEQKIKSNDP